MDEGASQVVLVLKNLPASEEDIKRRAIEEYLAQQKDEEEIKRRAIEEYLKNEAANKKDGEN